MSDYIIRKAETAREVVQLLKLEDSETKDNGAWNQRFASRVGDEADKQGIWIAYKAEEPAGYVVTTIGFDGVKYNAWIHYANIEKLPEETREELMNIMKEWAETKGYRELFIRVPSEMHEHYTKKWGFVLQTVIMSVSVNRVK